MKNKIGEKLFVGLLTVAVCVFLAFVMQIKATDAFVVEEEAVIGAPEPERIAPPVQPPIPMQEENTGPVKKKAVEKEEEKKTEIKTEEETVSRNALPPVFQVPARRKEAVEPVTEEVEVQPEPPEEAAEPLEEEQEKSYAWLMLIACGICLFCGMIRILHRLLIRCGKL